MTRQILTTICLMTAMIILLVGCGETTISADTKEVTPTEIIPAVSDPKVTATKQTASEPMPTSSPKPKKTEPPSEPEPKVAALSKNIPYAVDLNGDGKKETVTITTGAGSGRGIATLTVKDNNGRESVVSNEGAFISAYYLVNKSGACVVISMDAASDDYWSVVYRLDGTTPVEACNISGYIEKIDNTTVKVFDPVYTLGTWNAYRDYTFNDGFILNPSGDGLWHVTENDKLIVTSKELPVQLLENGAYKKATLKAGTEIRVIATDQQTLVLLELTDGRQGKIVITRDSWMVMIEGVQDEEWFKSLPYSG